MSNKVIMSICIDSELIDIVNELKSRRSFSKFIQDSLRSHRVVIESESLQCEKNSINEEIERLKQRQKAIDERLEAVKIAELEKDQSLELELRLRELNEMKSSMEIWESLPMNKRPQNYHDWFFERKSIGEKLRTLGFDFSTLKEGKS